MSHLVRCIAPLCSPRVPEIGDATKTERRELCTPLGCLLQLINAYWNTVGGLVNLHMILHMGPLVEKKWFLFPSSVCAASIHFWFEVAFYWNCLRFFHLLLKHVKSTTGTTQTLCYSTRPNIFSSPSPVPQALSLARHAEAIPVVGEVTVNKQGKTVS